LEEIIQAIKSNKEILLIVGVSEFSLK